MIWGIHNWALLWLKNSRNSRSRMGETLNQEHGAGVGHVKPSPLHHVSVKLPTTSSCLPYRGKLLEIIQIFPWGANSSFGKGILIRKRTLRKGLNPQHHRLTPVHMQTHPLHITSTVLIFFKLQAILIQVSHITFSLAWPWPATYDSRQEQRKRWEKGRQLFFSTSSFWPYLAKGQIFRTWAADTLLLLALWAPFGF